MVYWTRVGTAILAGILCHFLRLSETLGLFLTLAIYVGTSIIFERVIPLEEDETGNPLSSNVWAMGIGTYYILWIMVWTLLNTVLP